MTIARTILSQLNTIDRMATFAWGAKDFFDMKDGLKFKTSGMVKWQGYVYIKYNKGTDLYDIDFYRIRNFEVFNAKTVTDVYAEDLVNIIDQQVG